MEEERKLKGDSEMKGVMKGTQTLMEEDEVVGGVWRARETREGG